MESNRLYIDPAVRRKAKRILNDPDRISMPTFQTFKEVLFAVAFASCSLLMPLRATCFQRMTDSVLQRTTLLVDTPTSPGLRGKFIRSAATLLLTETIPWSVDRYIRHMDYADISFTTLGHNSRLTSWSWDGDGFTTNQFGHPYHGSFFFNSFRANGYNFWQSAAASFGGSYIWETAAENQAPAPNDFINTGFGGMILGEMTYRLANKIINNHARGFTRQLSEVTAFLINPSNGFTRIVRGQWGRYGTNSRERDSSVIDAEVDIGTRRIGFRTKKSETGLYGHIKLVYGSPFEKNKTPFSHIYINAELGKDDSSKLNILSVYGSLRGWKTFFPASGQLLLTANYDYIRNSSFFYSAQSLRLNLYTTLLKNNLFSVNGFAGASFILLSAVPDNYSYEDRNYDYCTGAGYNAGISARFANRIYCNATYRGAWLQTLNGNASHYILHAFTGEIAILFSKVLSVCTEPGYFSLTTYYHARQTISKTYPYLRLSVRYSLHAG